MRGRSTRTLDVAGLGVWSSMKPMRHLRDEVPAYVLWVEGRPTMSGKGKATYQDAVRRTALAHVPTPIVTDDVEIEIVYSTSRKGGIRSDIDNIIKPTLDALTGSAFGDDRQVRSVVATLWLQRERGVIGGPEEQLTRLAMSFGPDFVMVSVYSDSRLRELGGPSEVESAHYDEALQWLAEKDRPYAELLKRERP